MKLSGAGDAPMKWGVVIAMSATNFTQARAAGRARQATPRKAGLDSNVDHAHVDANVDPAPPPCRLARPAPPQGVFFTLPFAVAVFMVRGWEAQNGGAGEVFASAGALTGILVGWHLPGHQWPSRRMGVLRCTGPACCISRLASWQHRPPRAASRRRRLWVAQQLGQAGRQRCKALLPPPPPSPHFRHPSAPSAAGWLLQLCAVHHPVRLGRLQRQVWAQARHAHRQRVPGGQRCVVWLCRQLCPGCWGEGPGRPAQWRARVSSWAQARGWRGSDSLGHGGRLRWGLPTPLQARGITAHCGAGADSAQQLRTRALMRAQGLEVHPGRGLHAAAAKQGDGLLHAVLGGWFHCRPGEQGGGHCARIGPTRTTPASLMLPTLDCLDGAGLPCVPLPGPGRRPQPALQRAAQPARLRARRPAADQVGSGGSCQAAAVQVPDSCWPAREYVTHGFLVADEETRCTCCRHPQVPSTVGP